jgi:hypothetical protein
MTTANVKLIKHTLVLGDDLDKLAFCTNATAGVFAGADAASTFYPHTVLRQGDKVLLFWNLDPDEAYWITTWYKTDLVDAARAVFGALMKLDTVAHIVRPGNVHPALLKALDHFEIKALLVETPACNARWVADSPLRTDVVLWSPKVVDLRVRQQLRYN